MDSSNWQSWAAMLIGVVGAFNPALAATLSMVTTGLATLKADSDADKALFQQWQAFCQTMIAHGGAPTEAEHQAALDFANQVHAANQSA